MGILELIGADRLYRALKIIRDHGKATASEIYAAWGSSTMYKNRALEHLTEQGYLEKWEQWVGKKRFKFYRLTKKGEKLLELLEDIARLDQAPVSAQPRSSTRTAP